MKPQYQITAVILALLVLFSAVSCTRTENKASAGKTKTIVDCSGRKVEIPQNPKHVACLYATAAHMMAMLDEGDKISGAPNGVKFDVLMEMKYPEIKDAAVPYQEGSINGEELLRTNTDLALVRASIAENEGETEKLDKLGIPYVVVDYTNTAELKTAVSVVGTVFNKEEQAGAYISFLEDTISLVKRRLKTVKEKEMPQVYHSVNEATRTDAQGDISSQIMNLAGVKDISIEKGTISGGEKTYTTLEEIYKWDPDAVVANESSVTEYILTDSKWKGLKAVKEKKVYTLPVGATRWCHPGSMEAHMGVLAIASQFYPDQFQDVDLKAYTKDYYETYFNLKLDDHTLEKILSGQGMRISNAPIE